MEEKRDYINNNIPDTDDIREDFLDFLEDRFDEGSL